MQPRTGPPCRWQAGGFGAGRLAAPRRDAHFRAHGVAHADSWQRIDGHAVLGGTRDVAAGRHDGDVSADGCVPLDAMAETDFAMVAQHNTDALASLTSHAGFRPPRAAEEGRRSAPARIARSEERRVGKECRSRRSTYH